MATPENSLLNDITALQRHCESKRGVDPKNNELAAVFSVLQQSVSGENYDNSGTLEKLWKKMGQKDNPPRNLKSFALRLRDCDTPTIDRLKDILFVQCPKANKEALNDYFEATLRAAGWNPPAVEPLAVEMPESKGQAEAGAPSSPKLYNRTIIPLPEDRETLKEETQGNFGLLLRRLCRSIPKEEGSNECLGVNGFTKAWNKNGWNKVNSNYFNESSRMGRCPEFLNRGTKGKFLATTKAALGMEEEEFAKLAPYIEECVDTQIRKKENGPVIPSSFLIPLPEDIETLKATTNGNFGLLLRHLRQSTPQYEGSPCYLSKNLLIKRWNNQGFKPYSKNFFVKIETDNLCPQFLNEQTRDSFLNTLKEILPIQPACYDQIEVYAKECLDSMIMKSQTRQENAKRTIVHSVGNYSLRQLKLTPEELAQQKLYNETNAEERAKILKNGGDEKDLKAAGLLNDLPPEAFKKPKDTTIDKNGAEVEGTVQENRAGVKRPSPTRK